MRLNDKIKRRIIKTFYYLLPVMIILMALHLLILRNHGAGLESGARSSLIYIYNAETVFYMMNHRYGTLEELVKMGALEERFATGITGVYKFEVEVNHSGFEVFATPLYYGQFDPYGNLPVRSFYLNEKEFLTGDDKQGKRADASDTPIN